MGCYGLVKEGETIWDLLCSTCMDLDIAAAAVVIMYNRCWHGIFLRIVH